jgi:YD repeat-containing protein
MKKLLSLLLALTVMLSMFACTEPDKSDITPTGDGDEPPVDDGLVTIYLPVSRTEYKADGSKGHKQELYTYTDKGLILRVTSDIGLVEEIWSEDDYSYVYLPHAYNGTPDRVLEMSYNEHGHLQWHVQTDYYYNNLTGELTETKADTTNRDRNYTYFYTADGRIDYVKYDVYINGLVPYTLCHYYDDNGNVMEIGWEHWRDNKLYYEWQYDFRYDDQDRLITCTTRSLEGMIIYQYEYNPAGQLARVTKLKNQRGVPLDDQHVREMDYPARPSEHSYNGEIVFAYDAQGRLTCQMVYDKNMALVQEQTCQYRDGKLYKITDQAGKTVLLTTNEGEAGTVDATLITDSKGNVVKRINKNGDYVLFEYQTFRLTPEEAEYAQSVFYCYNGLDSTGQPHITPLEGGLSARQTVTYPVSDLYPYLFALKD